MCTNAIFGFGRQHSGAAFHGRGASQNMEAKQVLSTYAVVAANRHGRRHPPGMHLASAASRSCGFPLEM